MEEVTRLRRALWVFAAAFVAHEFEEWSIAAWFERNFDNSTGLSPEGVWFGLVAISAIGVAWIALATRISDIRVMAWVAIPFVGLVAVGNALQHLVWTLQFREYAPGFATSNLLMAPAAIFAQVQMLRARALPRVAILAVAAVCLFGAVDTWHRGRTMSPAQVELHIAVESMARAFLGDTNQVSK